MTAAARILLVEDHQLLAEALALHLRAAGAEVVLADVSRETDEALLAAGLRADVVVLDLDLGPGPDRLPRDGLSLIQPLRQAGTGVVVLTGSADLARWGRCVAAGAETVLPKTEPVAELFRVISAVAAGDVLDPPPWRDSALRAWQAQREEHRRLVTPLERLTPRELAVLELFAEGHSATAIAARDFVSETTVRSQIKSVLQKLDVRSQLQAVALLNRARRAGWSSAPQSPRAGSSGAGPASARASRSHPRPSGASGSSG